MSAGRDARGPVTAEAAVEPLQGGMAVGPGTGPTAVAAE